MRAIEHTMNITKQKWGFLRESSKEAKGNDPLTGLCRTGLEEYLKVIYPHVTDWIHNKPFGEHGDDIKYRIKPDYRSEQLKLIIEFDGLPHYKNVETIIKDEQNTIVYQKYGYKVIRIPYFIQLTNDTVKKMFGVSVKEPLFNIQYPSLGETGMRHNPSSLCPEGVKRMAKEFSKYPEQYEVNLNSLRNMSDKRLSGIEFLEQEYNKINASCVSH